MGKEHILHSFVVRLWLEQCDDGQSVWRGHIRHVQNDREAYIRNLEEICEFLEDVSGVPMQG